jgi:hypothetical protein
VTRANTGTIGKTTTTATTATTTKSAGATTGVEERRDWRRGTVPRKTTTKNQDD